jgi:hypothetical protein
MLGRLQMIRTIGVSVFGGLMALSSAVNAEPVPKSFPPGIANLYWHESAKSTRKKCQTFTTISKTKAECVVDGQTLLLGFDKKQQIILISFLISPVGYKECTDSILAMLGVAARSEDKDGNEIWSLAYTNSRGEKTGGVLCYQGDEGPRMTFAL